MDPGKPPVAVVHEILPHHAPAEGTAAEHGLAQALGLDDGRQFVGPSAAVLVAGRVRRLRRFAVSAQVVGDEPMVAGKLAADLADEGQMALGEAVDQYDFRAVGIAPLAY